MSAYSSGAPNLATHYQGWQYRGGRFTNHGLLTRPRYVAQFPEISINLPGSYTYTFSRFPASDAGVILETASAPPDEAVRRLTTQLRIRIDDQNGRVVRDGSGSPQGRGPNQIWVNSSAAANHSLSYELSAARSVGLRAMSAADLDRSGRSADVVTAQCSRVARRWVGTALRGIAGSS